MKWSVRYVSVILFSICLWVLSESLAAQHIEHFDSFVAANYPQMGHRSANHWMIPQELRNLRGPVQQLTQYAYGERDRLITYDGVTRTDSYSYIFDEEKKIIEVWMFLDHDVPAFKEFYYDFKEARPQYHMKFYAPLKMTFSKTFQYNNRYIPIGKKTTSGEDLALERYQLDLIKDTIVVYANDFNKEFLGNLLVKTFDKRTGQLEELTYHDNGSIHECLIYDKDILSEAFEYDTLGRVIERQLFKTKPVLSQDGESSKPLGYGKLVIYEYNQDELLQSEEHRFIDTTGADYNVSYHYDDQKRLESRQFVRGERVVKTDVFNYNDHEDRVLLKEGDSSQPMIEYSNYDEHGNWTKRIVHTKDGRRRFVRRIEYFK